MNKDSVMAMLEAFVHDPLINWRLLNTAEADADNALSTANTSETHMPGTIALFSPPSGIAPYVSKMMLCTSVLLHSPFCFTASSWIACTSKLA